MTTLSAIIAAIAPESSMAMMVIRVGSMPA